MAGAIGTVFRGTVRRCPTLRSWVRSHYGSTSLAPWPSSSYTPKRGGRSKFSSPIPEFENDPSISGHDDLYRLSIADPDRFWGRLARSRLRWVKDFDVVQECNIKEGKAAWFINGKLNVTGYRDSSRGSIEWILTKQGTGNAAIVVVGGEKEMLEAHPGSYNLILKERKGFVKLAIQTGACLVPVFSFGENDLFFQAKNPHGSYLRSFQEAFKKIIGFTPPLLQTFGVLPVRRPVHTVIGQPIEVETILDPDQSTIDLVHQQYMNALSELFDQHKVEYGVDKNLTLNFM